jgi:hypothetical protein
MMKSPIRNSRLIITTLIAIAGVVLTGIQSVLAEVPTASNDNCYLVTIANLPAQTSSMQSCLELDLPTAVGIPGVGDVVVTILLPNEDAHSCPHGTTTISSEGIENQQLLCLSIS